MKTKDLSLYIHIPFCVQKCKYCDFLSFSVTERDRNSYLRELEKELKNKSVQAKGYQLISIFFGGGTPSLLTGDQMKRLMDVIKEHYFICENAEISMESNPGTLTKEKLKAFYDSGINRISIGLQSTEDVLLKKLGRIHTYEQFLENYNLAREVGFTNINIDLMSALPGQTMDDYKETLSKVLALCPEHISAYSLIIEEGTPFATDDTVLNQLPDEETDRKMYQYTKEILRVHGYERYEISNYAKEGYECRHNKVYWTGGAYLGFGLGASSYFEGERYRNETELKVYLQNSNEKYEVEQLSEQDRIEEYMYLGMRLTKGISVSEFKRRFHKDLYDVYGDILKRQEKEGLIIAGKEWVALTDKGLDVSNYVFSDYLL